MEEKDTAYNEVKKFSEDMYNRFLEVSEPHTHIVKHQFEQIKNGLLMLDCNDDFKFKLEQITMGFEIFDSKSSGCYGWKNADLLYTQTKTDEYININLHSYIKNRYKYICIHEFTHMICYDFINVKDHTLEFAIVMYCLEVRLMEDTGSFFRSYDIAEDRAYQSLYINPSRFDGMIRGIKWGSLEELTEKALMMATRIRLKLAPFTVEKWESDFIKDIK